MKKYLYLSLSLFLFTQLLLAQETLPILHTTTKVVSIKDGAELRKDYWTILPEEKLDVYVADKTSAVKTVSFYSDIDSISFEVKPRDQYNFIILLNGKDSCFTQIRSGITYNPETDMVDAPADSIPFILTPYNNISIQTIVNHTDTVNLMFHTASSSVYLTKEATAKMNSMKWDKKEKVNSWGGASEVRNSTKNHIQIGQMHWDDILIGEDDLSGRMTGGKFGLRLFKDKIVEIDFEKSMLIIHSSMPKIDEKFEKMDIVFRGSNLYLEGKFNVKGNLFKNKFLIHSGHSGTFLFDDNFVSENKLGNQLEVISESKLQDSFGNILKTKKVMLEDLNFGSYHFSNIPVGLFEGAIGQHNKSVVGADVLKRFNIIIDMQQAYIYFKANQLMNLPYLNV